jgi:hypothetical protein
MSRSALPSLSNLSQDLSNVEIKAAVGSQALVENDCDLKRINQTLGLSAGFEVAVNNARRAATNFRWIYAGETIYPDFYQAKSYSDFMAAPCVSH